MSLKHSKRPCKMARGGELGVHRSFRGYQDKGGESYAGAKAKEHTSSGKEIAKQDHKVVLEELRSMPNPKLKGLADGGKVDDAPPAPWWTAQGSSIAQGISNAGKHAEGGEIHEDESHESAQDEMHEMLADELMSAIESKDKKRVAEAMKSLSRYSGHEEEND